MPRTADPEACEGLRDRKKRETRARIHSAALSLALERGPDEVTVEEIAAAADISPRTFFNYFPAKEDALTGTDPERVAHVADLLLARPLEESLRAALRGVVLEGLLQLEQDREVWRMRTALAARWPELVGRLAGTNARLERALVEAAYQRAGTDPATDIGPSMEAHLAMAATRAALDQHRAVGITGSIAERLDAAYAALDRTDVHRARA